MDKTAADIATRPGTRPLPGQSLVALRDSEVRTGDGQVLLAIPSLTVFAGERLVVTGPSGSGKSLLLGTLAGRWAPGTRFHGERSASFSHVGFVPQRGLDALHPLVPLGRQLGRVTGASRGRVSEVLEAVGLNDAGLRRRRPAELSGGQAQRAAVALAALSDAPLVLADEPSSALDHETRELLLRLLDDVLGPDRTLVMSTHDPAVEDRLATRRITLSNGAIVSGTSPASSGMAA